MRLATFRARCEYPTYLDLTITPRLANRAFNANLNLRTPIARDDAQAKEFFRKPEGWGIPFGRAGHSRDYAQAVLNFAVNGYITGSTLVIDGGWLLAHA